MMPDYSFSRNPDLRREEGGRRNGPEFRRKHGAGRGSNRFVAAALPPEVFFAEMLKRLRQDDLDDRADTLQKKSIFLDLGTLDGSTVFIVWITCPDTYSAFSNTQDGLDIAKAASKAARSLGIECPVRTVIAAYVATTVGGLC